MPIASCPFTRYYWEESITIFTIPSLLRHMQTFMFALSHLTSRLNSPGSLSLIWEAPGPSQTFAGLTPVCSCLSHTEELSLFPGLDSAFQMCLTNVEKSERITSLNTAHLPQNSWVYPIWPFPNLILLHGWLVFAPDFPNGLSGSPLLNSTMSWSLQPRLSVTFAFPTLFLSMRSSRAPAFVHSSIAC